MPSSSTKVFFHNRNRPKNMYRDGTLEFEVSEIFYEAALELTGVAYAAINRSYPRAERDKNPKIMYLWESGQQQAKEFLTRYKNIVKDAVIPLVTFKKHRTPYDATNDQHTREFRALIIDNNFYMLYTKLKDFAPMLVPPEEVNNFQQVLEPVYEKGKEKLTEALSYYEAIGKEPLE